MDSRPEGAMQIRKLRHLAYKQFIGRALTKYCRRRVHPSHFVTKCKDGANNDDQVAF